MSGYYCGDRFFKDVIEEMDICCKYEEIIEKMDNCLDKLKGRHREYAIYRFGLDGQKPHSSFETAERFSIPVERVKSLDFRTLRKMGLKLPHKRSSKVNEFLNG